MESMLNLDNTLKLIGIISIVTFIYLNLIVFTNIKFKNLFIRYSYKAIKLNGNSWTIQRKIYFLFFIAIWTDYVVSYVTNKLLTYTSYNDIQESCMYYNYEKCLEHLKILNQRDYKKL